MKTDSLIAEFMKAAYPILLAMGGLTNVRYGDYTFEPLEVKDLNRRIDGLGLPTHDGLPAVVVEFYAQKVPDAYRNALHKLFRFIEDRQWKGRFLVILIFVDRSVDPGDEVITSGPVPDWLVRVYLDEWLTTQPETPYTNCLRLLTTDRNELRDLKLVQAAYEELPDSDESRRFIELFKNTFIKKYPDFTLLMLEQMLNLNEPFDPRQTVLYQSIHTEGLKKGLRQAKVEDARRMFRRGLDLALIHDITELPIEELQRIRQEDLDAS
jgi:predicted transposase YdaD